MEWEETKWNTSKLEEIKWTRSELHGTKDGS